MARWKPANFQQFSSAAIHKFKNQFRRILQEKLNICFQAQYTFILIESIEIGVPHVEPTRNRTPNQKSWVAGSLLRVCKIIPTPEAGFATT